MEQIEQAVICALDPHVDPNLKAQVSNTQHAKSDYGVGFELDH
jgi:hypothetical protein